MTEGESPSGAKPVRRIGSYELLRPLGTGGMSSVFKAVHVETGHEVALKVLPRALAKNVTLLQRFLREAKNAESLEHPTIVSIFDRGVDDGRHYLVLEFVDGGDLHDRVRASGPLGIAEAIAAIRTVAEGLRYAASRGLIHRDIKPANILMTPDGQVKLIDLGLARQAEFEDERVTREGTTVGTVDFMSPEQARDSHATSERSDIYSLGCTFYFLLTGQPPYPGGDVADKLARHCTKPAPDPREIRPEVPARLVDLIRRMMAKRPERRFASYDDLIAALDSSMTSDEAPLDALIVDDEPEDPPASGALDALIVDDDDASEAGVQPLEALVVEDDDEDEAPDLAGQSLDALVVEDDEAEGQGEPARPPSDRTSGSGARGHDSSPSVDEISLADLASLDEVPTRSSGSIRPASPEHASSSGEVLRRTPNPKRPQPVEETAPPPDNLLDDEPVEGTLTGPAPQVLARRSEEEAKAWIRNCALVGLGLMLLIIGIHQLIKASTATPEPEGPIVETSESPPPAPVEEPETPSKVVARPSTPPAAKPAIPKKAVTMVTKSSPVLVPASPIGDVRQGWVEPEDPRPPGRMEARYPTEVVSRFVPDWATIEVPARIPGPLISVRRIADPRDPAQKTSLGLAFDAIGGTVELADDGPFFEDDLRFSGEARLVRARPGYRPMVSVVTPRFDAVREQHAVFLIDGKSLILDGLDLILNVQDLRGTQEAFFRCRAGSLTLRNCTITVLNPRSQPFAVFRSEGTDRPSRIRIESTLVRASASTILELAEGPAEVAIDRSLLIGSGPILACRAAASDQRVHVARSLVCSRGPVFDLGAANAGTRPAALKVRALGSTFSRIASPTSANPASTSLIVSRREEVAAGEALNWLGDSNDFSGWRDWLASADGRSVKVADLKAARLAWPSTDPQSRESPATLPERTFAEIARVSPADLRDLAPDRQQTLSSVAMPSPYLFEKTVEAFDRVRVPKLSAQLLAPALPGVSTSGVNAFDPRPDMPAPKKVGLPPTRDLIFDLAATPWLGDLGNYLRDQVRAGDRRLRVRVRGAGEHPCTPFKMPVGVSLEIVVEPPRGATDVFPSWSVARGSHSEAVLEASDADLVLSNVRLTSGPGIRPRSLVRVDRGHLILVRCRLIASGPGGGGLISFRATSTRPLAGDLGPFESPPAMPVCSVNDSVLITTGDALTAEVGRGVVSFSHSAIAAGTAFVLKPSRVARSRFEAGLWIDHCTIAAEGTLVSLGRWPGSPPGPDRPWLVTSRDSAFLSGFDRGARDVVLLRVEPESLPFGTLFWQDANDAFDVGHFWARTDIPPAQNRRPDLQRQWVEFWGESHIRNVTGPGRTVGTLASVRLVDRLHSGDVAPGDLALDPDHHPGRSKLEIGADLRRLQVTPKRVAKKR